VELFKQNFPNAAGLKNGELGAKANAYLAEEGVLLRAAVDALTICPPLTITVGDADFLIEKIGKVLNRVTAELAA
jgi:4-aminobutyrate---pyruvate transaminase